MNLKFITIKDFKSIKWAERIPIKNNILCLVGKNESGKSSLIEAISYLNLSKKYENDDLTNKSSQTYGKGLPYIAGTFDIQDTALQIQKEIINEEYFSEPYLKQLLPNFDKKNTDLSIKIERWGNGIKNMQVSLINNKEGKLIELDKYLKSAKLKKQFIEKLADKFIPDIELFENESLQIKPASIAELRSNKIEFETLRRILTLAGCHDYSVFSDKKRIHKTLKKYSSTITSLFKKNYQQDDSIEIEFSYNDNKLDLIISDSSKEFFDISERSTGFRYFFAFLINKYYYNSRAIKSNIFLLDEPGRGALHPKGARDLIRSFSEISKLDSKIIYTTHNTYLTYRADRDCLFHVIKEINTGTKIDIKPFQNNYQNLRAELGIYLNDSFLLGEINLLVEGSTEALALPILLRNNNFSGEIDPILNFINIYNTETASKMKSAIGYIDSIGSLGGLVLVDSDQAGERALNTKKVKEILSKDNWEVLKISEVFKDKKERTFEDLFDQDDYIECFNKYYKQNMNSIDNWNKKPYTNFVSDKTSEPPLVNHLKKHYNSFLNNNGKEEDFNKVAIIRNLMDDINDIDDKKINSKYKYLKKYITQITNKIKTINKCLQ